MERVQQEKYIHVFGELKPKLSISKGSVVLSQEKVKTLIKEKYDLKSLLKKEVLEAQTLTTSEKTQRGPLRSPSIILRNSRGSVRTQG